MQEQAADDQQVDSRAWMKQKRGPGGCTGHRRSHCPVGSAEQGVTPGLQGQSHLVWNMNCVGETGRLVPLYCLRNTNSEKSSEGFAKMPQNVAECPVQQTTAKRHSFYIKHRLRGEIKALLKQVPTRTAYSNVVCPCHQSISFPPLVWSLRTLQWNTVMEGAVPDCE